MTHSVAKELVFVQKIGPAFSLDEVEAAHKALDRAGAPRQIKGEVLSLPQRIEWMHDMAVKMACDISGTFDFEPGECRCKLDERCSVCDAAAARAYADAKGW